MVWYYWWKTIHRKLQSFNLKASDSLLQWVQPLFKLLWMHCSREYWLQKLNNASWLMSAIIFIIVQFKVILQENMQTKVLQPKYSLLYLLFYSAVKSIHGISLLAVLPVAHRYFVHIDFVQWSCYLFHIIKCRQMDNFHWIQVNNINMYIFKRKYYRHQRANACVLFIFLNWKLNKPKHAVT